MTDDTREIIRAIERNTRAVKTLDTSVWIYTMILMIVLIFGFGCPRAKGAVIISAPIAAEQYWYTMHVPLDGGVYPMDVYAPALPSPFADESGYVLGAPPLPSAVPEPSTASLLALALAMAILLAMVWRMRK